MKKPNKPNTIKMHLVAKKQVTCEASGTTYDVTVSGFYDARDVLNVEFRYVPATADGATVVPRVDVVDERDDPELEAWQTAYVATLGRRVR